MKLRNFLNRKNIAISFLVLISIGVSTNIFREQINPQKTIAYKRAKKLFDPDLYLLYRLTDRIIESNDIKRPIRVAVRKGAACDVSDPACAALQLLPDIDKSTNFDIWASQVVNSMAGQPNAAAYSSSGTLYVNTPLLKEVMGKPTQLSCVIAHELAHITQNHSEEENKQRIKYELEAAGRISKRVKSLHDQQNGAYVMAAIFGGMASAYSGDNSSLNQVTTQIQFNQLSAQMAAPEIGKIALQYSPTIGKSINQMKGLGPGYIKQAMSSTEDYLRDVTLKLKAFSRGQEYEADLLGLRYVSAAGFNPQDCIKLWTETMPHDQDKIIARLLPEGTKDPGDEEGPKIFINKTDQKDNAISIKCKRPGLKGKDKVDCQKEKRRQAYCDPIEDDCDTYTNARKKGKSNPVPEDVMAMLSTHPSAKRRAKAIQNELKNKKLFSDIEKKGKEARSSKLMRDWNFDEDSNSVVISDIMKSPQEIGLQKDGITGIDVDKFLD